MPAIMDAETEEPGVLKRPSLWVAEPHAGACVARRPDLVPPEVEDLGQARRSGCAGGSP